MNIVDRVNNLIKEIETVFADIRLGDGMSLHQGKAIDDNCTDKEIEEARNLDPWERWQDIPQEVLIECGCALLAHSYMDSDAFIFHLPACMRLALQTFQKTPNTFYDTCIYHLTREPQYVIKEYNLSQAQVGVISKFWELHFDTETINLGEHYEKRLLEWLEAAQLAQPQGV